ncbi:MAG: hypothetical protein MZV64_10020 [Ignavibacteriales bacterium]|nr:hypothetical protein [Ignavibacteriales bacterium]
MNWPTTCASNSSTIPLATNFWPHCTRRTIACRRRRTPSPTTKRNSCRSTVPRSRRWLTRRARSSVVTRSRYWCSTHAAPRTSAPKRETNPSLPVPGRPLSSRTSGTGPDRQ